MTSGEDQQESEYQRAKLAAENIHSGGVTLVAARARDYDNKPCLVWRLPGGGVATDPYQAARVAATLSRCCGLCTGVAGNALLLQALHLLSLNPHEHARYQQVLTLTKARGLSHVRR